MTPYALGFQLGLRKQADVDVTVPRPPAPGAFSSIASPAGGIHPGALAAAVALGLIPAGIGAYRAGKGRRASGALAGKTVGDLSQMGAVLGGLAGLGPALALSASSSPLARGLSAGSLAAGIGSGGYGGYRLGRRYFWDPVLRPEARHALDALQTEPQPA